MEERKNGRKEEKKRKKTWEKLIFIFLKGKKNKRRTKDVTKDQLQQT